MAKGTLNKVMILGRLGNDPELRQTQKGTSMVNISIATNDGWGENQKTEWHRVVVFGKPAEAINQYCSKGSQLFIEGRLSTSSYEKNGEKRYSTDIIASSFEFINGGNAQQQNSGFSPRQAPSPQQQQSQNNMPSFDEISSFDDEMPF